MGEIGERVIVVVVLAPWTTADGAEVLFGYIKDHTIWSSLRFWTAAYFDAVQQERAVAVESVHCNRSASHPLGPSKIGVGPYSEFIAARRSDSF